MKKKYSILLFNFIFFYNLALFGMDGWGFSLKDSTPSNKATTKELELTTIQPFPDLFGLLAQQELEIVQKIIPEQRLNSKMTLPDIRQGVINPLFKAFNQAKDNEREGGFNVGYQKALDDLVNAHNLQDQNNALLEGATDRLCHNLIDHPYYTNKLEKLNYRLISTKKIEEIKKDTKEDLLAVLQQLITNPSKVTCDNQFKELIEKRDLFLLMQFKNGKLGQYLKRHTTKMRDAMKETSRFTKEDIAKVAFGGVLFYLGTVLKHYYDG